MEYFYEILLHFCDDFWLQSQSDFTEKVFLMDLSE